MFYNKRVDIIERTDGYTDELGIYHKGAENILKTIYCDVQPFSKELAYREYGYNEEVSYRIFTDDTSFNLGTIIKYNNEYCVAKKVIPWDSFQEVMVNNE